MHADNMSDGETFEEAMQRPFDPGRGALTAVGEGLPDLRKQAAGRRARDAFERDPHHQGSGQFRDAAEPLEDLSRALEELSPKASGTKTDSD